ncbi:hypothetical protein NM208_g11020 [Fusarium decemcellulare]|uniref:Uncharacterized protein n=1 Tax=Fusarium decemcellulare TaxID=57161 RepID=A0ACC1RVV4_9HYPO|nr:hypothetical protein NM208_g11020 [Fusarium decemcellulare]
MATPSSSDKRPSFSTFLKKVKQKGKKSDESECSTPQRRGKANRVEVASSEFWMNMGGEVGTTGEDDSSNNSNLMSLGPASLHWPSPLDYVSGPHRRNLESLSQPSEKAKLRRAQVRRAQIQHRQRKAEYQKQLELEVTHYRELISLTEFETNELKKDNDAIRSLLTTKGITIPNCGSQCLIRPSLTKVQLEGSDAWIDEALGMAPQPQDQQTFQGEEEMFADVNVDDIIVTLKKDDQMDTPVFSIRSSSSSSNTSSPPAPEEDLNLSPEEEQMAVNFILSLEHICWDHFWLGDYPSHAHLTNDEAKGHTLMASSLCMAHAPEEVFSGRKLISSASSCHNRRKLGLVDEPLRQPDRASQVDAIVLFVAHITLCRFVKHCDVRQPFCGCRTCGCEMKVQNARSVRKDLLQVSEVGCKPDRGFTLDQGFRHGECNGQPVSVACCTTKFINHNKALVVNVPQNESHFPHLDRKG